MTHPDFPSGTSLVVGGSGGIGRAIALALARAGSDVALTYHRNVEAAERAAAEIRDQVTTASIHPLDLADPTAAARLVEPLNGLHTVVFAAGAPIGQPYVSQIEALAWSETVRIELDGFFHVVRACLPALRASGGSIVHVGSAGTRRYPPGDALSVVPKAGAEALVRAIAREEGRYGIRANGVAVGVVEDGMFLRLRGSELGPEWEATAQRRIALRRFGRAAEVAEVVAFLASRRAAYVTGQIVAVDGGYSL